MGLCSASSTRVLTPPRWWRSTGSSAGRLRFVLEARLSTEALTEKTATVPASYLLPTEIGALELRDDAIAPLITEHARGMPTAPLDLYRIGLA